MGRVRAKLRGWKEKILSQVGKEILLKAVVQAILTYSINVFKLPKMFCKELNSLLSKFYWGNSGSDSLLVWMSWSNMGRSKPLGGLSFRDLECFNKALLVKQGWRLLHCQESLAAPVLKAKYYPNSTFLAASLGLRPSYAWRSICSSKGLLKEGLLWRVGDGLLSKSREINRSQALHLFKFSPLSVFCHQMPRFLVS